jgi:hypothetical protein
MYDKLRIRMGLRLVGRVLGEPMAGHGAPDANRSGATLS